MPELSRSDGNRTRREQRIVRRGWLSVALIAVLASAAALCVLLLRSNAPVSGSLAVTYSNGGKIPGLRMERLKDVDAKELAGGSLGESPVYKITASAPLDGEAKLRFTIPTNLGASERERLLVAHRESEQEMWLLSPGEVEGDEYVYRTERFSFFQLRLPAIRLNLPGRKQIEETVLGMRGTDPRCSSPPEQLSLAIDSPGNASDPLIRGCLDREDDEILLRIANRRSIGLELAPTEGIELRRTSGRGLTEEFWSRLNQALPGGGELIPGGGTATIAISKPPRRADFVVNNSSLPIDLLITLVSQGQASEAQKQVAKLAELAGCAYRGAHGDLSFGYLRNIFVACGKLLTGTALAVNGAAIFGAVRTAYQVVDSVRALTGMRASATVSRSQAFMSCGSPAVYLYDELIAESTIVFEEHPEDCTYSTDGTVAGTVILEGLRWTSWGGDTAKASGYQVDNHDMDNNGFQRHLRSVTLSAPIRDSRDGAIYYSQMDLRSPDGELLEGTIPLATRRQD